MTNEELILQKLELLEGRIEPLIKSANSLVELKTDFVPLGNHAVALLIKELQEIESGFQLEDLLQFVKHLMRNTRNLTFSLNQLASMIEFAKDIEPLLKSVVPQFISYMDNLEQRGVFRIINAMIDLRAKVASTFSTEDIDRLGDGFVALLGLMENISNPKVISFLEKAIEVPANIDLEKSEKVGPLGLFIAGFDDEIKEGLGIALQFTKALGKINKDLNNPHSQSG